MPTNATNAGAGGDPTTTTTDATPIAQLPCLPSAQRGESTASAADGSFSVRVANAGEGTGYLCAIQGEARFAKGLHPGTLYAIFTHPRNDGVFSGIQRVSYRRVLEEEVEERRRRQQQQQQGEGGKRWRRRAGGKEEVAATKVVVYRKVEVEQVGVLKILMARREFGTRLIVEEDARHAADEGGGGGYYQTRFTLVSSDALAKFQGSWTITPLDDEEGEEEEEGQQERGAAAATTNGSNNDKGCLCRLEQQVLPRGVPVYLQRVPVLGGLLRRVSLLAVERLLRDLLAVVADLRREHPEAAAMGDEQEVHAALDALKRKKRLAAQLASRGGGGGPAAFDLGDGSDDSAEDGDEKAA